MRITSAVLGLIIGALAGLVVMTPGHARHVSSEPAAQVETSCVPVEVAAFPDRIHVRCLTPTDSGIIYFAAPIGEPTTPAYLSQLNTALLSPPTIELLVFYYDDTTSGPPFGCAANDCRKIAYVVLQLKPGAPLN
jgi:hypothetical protein